MYYAADFLDSVTIFLCPGSVFTDIKCVVKGRNIQLKKVRFKIL